MIRTVAANINRNTGGCITLEEVSSVPGGNYVDVINDGAAQFKQLIFLMRQTFAAGCELLLLFSQIPDVMHGLAC